MTEQHNTITLTRQGLHRTLADLFSEVHDRPDRAGLPRIDYRDEFDQYAMRLEKTNVGYSVSCALNSQTSYQLNGRHFPGTTFIGTIMLHAAGAHNQTIEGFFK